MSSKITRAELEAKLASAQESINRRLSSLEGEVKVPRLAARVTGVERGDLRRIGIAVGVGLVSAWAIARLTRKKPRGRESYAEDLAEDIGQLVEDGYELDGAVRRAVRRNGGAPAVAAPRKSGALVRLFGVVLSVGLNSVLRHYLSDAGNAADSASGDS